MMIMYGMASQRMHNIKLLAKLRNSLLVTGANPTAL